MTDMKRLLHTCCTLLAALAACPADSCGLEAIDTQVLEWTEECSHKSVDCFMENLSETWNPENLLLASVPVIVLGNEKAFRCLELAWKSLMISEATTAALKLAVNRQRPDGDPHSRANSSFPSSHASSSFAVAFSISTYYPKWSIPAFGMSALIAYSRVYLDAHYPGDVIAGAAIGVMGGYLANRYLAGWHIDRAEVARAIPLRIEIGEGLGSVRIYFSRRL